MPAVGAGLVVGMLVVVGEIETVGKLLGLNVGTEVGWVEDDGIDDG